VYILCNIFSTDVYETIATLSTCKT